jgi:DNA-binding CsgD family transcriptional regulator
LSAKDAHAARLPKPSGDHTRMNKAESDGEAARHRIAFITIGQAPRDDVAPEILAMVERPVLCDQYGALDDIPAEEIARHAPGPGEDSLYTRLVDGEHVIVSTAFVEAHLEDVVRRADEAEYDLIAIITTGVFRPFGARTPLINGQRVVDAWIESLVMDDSRIGIIYPLKRQIAERDLRGHATTIRNPRAQAASGESRSLEEAARQLKGCDLVLMHSVGYTEAMAQQVASLTMAPVVTARRVIAGAIRLQLMQIDEAPEVNPTGMVERLPVHGEPLTRREREVVTLVLDGLSNKLIARRLDISYRTVEIHRGRAFGKLGVTSAADLIRQILLKRRP